MIPNLNYINEISDNDLTFKNKIIAIIKRDFPLENEDFIKHYKCKKHLLAAESVHKLKHKINMLGLKKGYDTAVKFENELRDNKDYSFKKFMEVLKTIDNYLKNI